VGHRVRRRHRDQLEQHQRGTAGGHHQQGYSRLADGSWPWLGTLFAYSLRDHANNISDWQSNFGLTRYDGSPKPGVHHLSNAMKQPLIR
jgi:hypothetical protein